MIVGIALAVEQRRFICKIHATGKRILSATSYYKYGMIGSFGREPEYLVLGEGRLALHLQYAICAATRNVERSRVGLANAAIASQVFCMVRNIPSAIYVSSHILKGDTPRILTRTCLLA